MDTNLSFKFTAVYSVDKENLTCEDMSMKVKIAGINYHLNKNDGDREFNKQVQNYEMFL